VAKNRANAKQLMEFKAVDRKKRLGRGGEEKKPKGNHLTLTRQRASFILKNNQKKKRGYVGGTHGRKRMWARHVKTGVIPATVWAKKKKGEERDDFNLVGGETRACLWRTRRAQGGKKEK